MHGVVAADRDADRLERAAADTVHIERRLQIPLRDTKHLKVRQATSALLSDFSVSTALGSHNMYFTLSHLAGDDAKTLQGRGQIIAKQL